MSPIQLTPGIRFLDATTDPESGLRFSVGDEVGHGPVPRIFVRDRAGGLMDSFPLADVDPDKSIEEVANDWLDEHRG